jgi:hypothetical protein
MEITRKQDLASVTARRTFHAVGHDAASSSAPQRLCDRPFPLLPAIFIVDVVDGDGGGSTADLLVMPATSCGARPSIATGTAPPRPGMTLCHPGSSGWQPR